jgi:hypothetical protein
MKMKHQPHFESATTEADGTERQRLKTLIADLGRKVRILDSEVDFEEQRSGIVDQSDAQYSMLARTTAARSENLKVTIATLEARLVSTTSVASPATGSASGRRRLRRNAAPRRLEAWLRLRSFANVRPGPAGV